MGFKFDLGVEVQDTITEFRGKITGRVEFITGCNQYCLTPKVGEDGAIRDSQYLDEQRLEAIPGAATTTLDNSKVRGFGPQAPKK